MNEKYKNYPIKFYSKRDNSVEYKSPYLRGSAKNLNVALNDIMTDLDQIEYDLQNYDDVQDVKFGNFKPAENLKGKHKKYLGQIDVIFDLNDIFKTDNTIQNIIKNPKDKIKHDKIIQLLKINNSRQNKSNNLYKGNVMNFIKKFKNYAEEFTKEPHDFENDGQYELEKEFEKEIDFQLKDQDEKRYPFKKYLYKIVHNIVSSASVEGRDTYKYTIKLLPHIRNEFVQIDPNNRQPRINFLSRVLRNNKKIKQVSQSYPRDELGLILTCIDVEFNNE